MEICLSTRLIEDQQADVFFEVVLWERRARVDFVEECVERREVGRPVAAEDGDVDREVVGAPGEGVVAVAGGDGFAQFAERGENGGEFGGGGGEGVAGDTGGCGGCWGRRAVRSRRVFGEGERGEGGCEGCKGGRVVRAADGGEEDVEFFAVEGAELHVAFCDAV